MKHPILLSTLAAVAVSLISGCATAPPAGSERAAADVKVYQGNNLPPDQYDVVRRLWVDSWRSSLLIPSYPSEADAIVSLQTEASRWGADGLINVMCRDQGPSTWSSSASPRIVCYANAIRVRRAQG
jgi:uncharacterized protein YbjQ (UPF0145 family)